MKTPLLNSLAVLPMLFGAALLYSGCDKELVAPPIRPEKVPASLPYVKQVDVREKGGQTLRFEVASTQRQLLDQVDGHNMTVTLNAESEVAEDADIASEASAVTDGSESLEGRPVLSIRLVGSSTGKALHGYQVEFSAALQAALTAQKAVLHVDLKHDLFSESGKSAAGWVRTPWCRKVIINGYTPTSQSTCVRVYYAYPAGGGVWRQALLLTSCFSRQLVVRLCTANRYIDDFYVYQDRITGYSVSGSCQ